jgi:hypothetical protein
LIPAASYRKPGEYHQQVTGNPENTINKLLETRRIPSTSYWKPGEYHQQVTGNPENSIDKLLETRRIPSTIYWKPGEYHRQVTGKLYHIIKVGLLTPANLKTFAIIYTY